MSSKKPAILFLSGVSGVGKTTIVATLQERNLNNSSCVFLHADAGDTLSFAEMVEQAALLERFQKIATHKWIEKIISEY
ncbi:MAG: ATP-binding protein [Nostoc sp.]|uniref:ATP-binding protein n=1 Tax=Nostoc sp. TaxID=1180 RepID=UPI002FF24F9A